MLTYKLDDRQMDSAFLQGESIMCRAVLSANDIKKGTLKVGDAIVVQLSKGGKFKGRVLSFNYVEIKDYVMGEFELRKESHTVKI